jgi:hypothetical protein
MATKKLKLEVEAISEILIADTESGAKVSNVEEEFEEEEDEQQLLLLLLQQASAEDEPQAETIINNNNFGLNRPTKTVMERDAHLLRLRHKL